MILNDKFGAQYIARYWDGAIEAYIKWSLQTDDDLAELAFDEFANELEFAATDVW
jgi:hypothetical protein